jgi:hypothetical protein
LGIKTGMISEKNHLGINISGNRIQLVELIYIENKILIGNVEEESSDIIPDFSLNESKLSNALQESFEVVKKKITIDSNNVSFTLPNSLFKIAQIPIDSSVSKSELKEYLAWEFSVLFPTYNLDEMKLNIIRIDEDKFYVSPQLIIILVKRSLLKILHEFSVRNNLALRFIDNAHFASQILLKRQSFGENDLILYLYLERNRLSFAIEKGGKTILFRLLNFDDLDNLPSLLRNEMAFVEGLNPNFINISHVFAAGEPEIESVSEKLFADMDINCRLLNPFTRYPVADHVNREFIEEKYTAFTPPAGIILRPI